MNSLSTQFIPKSDVPASVGIYPSGQMVIANYGRANVDIVCAHCSESAVATCARRPRLDEKDIVRFHAVGESKSEERALTVRITANEIVRKLSRASGQLEQALFRQWVVGDVALRAVVN